MVLQECSRERQTGRGEGDKEWGGERDRERQIETIQKTKVAE